MHAKQQREQHSPNHVPPFSRSSYNIFRKLTKVCPMGAWKVDAAGPLVDAATHVVHRLVGELHCVERLCVGGEALALQG